MALFFFPLDELYIPIPKYWSWKNYVTPKVPSNPKAWSKTSPVWEWFPPKRCWHHFLKSKLIFPSPEIADNPHPAILGRVVGDVVFLLNSWRKREKLLEGGMGLQDPSEAFNADAQVEEQRTSLSGIAALGWVAIFATLFRVWGSESS